MEEGLRARFARMGADGVDPCARLEVVEGMRREYESLARFHYRPGRPATMARVLCARDAREGGREGGIAGVLVVSMPTLNGRWREAAWPGRFAGEKRGRARRMNEELRVISRVIVDPRWRGVGVATRLVRAYLVRPLTPLTEAVAAMGRCCPFFAAAGMRGHPLGRSVRDERLLRTLRECGVSAWDLVEGMAGGRGGASHVAPPLGERCHQERCHRAARVWANASRQSRAWLDGPAEDLARRAGLALCARAVAYVDGD